MAAEPVPKGAWTIAGVLFLYMLINFADKAVVGLAAVPIMQELELTPRQFGLVGSSFFFCSRSRRFWLVSSPTAWRRVL
jgi:hypothetical protein